MPKLVYFNLQGRVQSARYLLGYKGVEFEDIRLTSEEWGPTKAAGTYGAGTPFQSTRLTMDPTTTRAKLSSTSCVLNTESFLPTLPNSMR